MGKGLTIVPCLQYWLALLTLKQKMWDWLMMMMIQYKVQYKSKRGRNWEGKGVRRSVEGVIRQTGVTGITVYSVSVGKV